MDVLLGGERCAHRGRPEEDRDRRTATQLQVQKCQRLGDPPEPRRRPGTTLVPKHSEGARPLISRFWTPFWERKQVCCFAALGNARKPLLTPPLQKTATVSLFPYLLLSIPLRRDHGGRHPSPVGEHPGRFQSFASAGNAATALSPEGGVLPGKRTGTGRTPDLRNRHTGYMYVLGSYRKKALQREQTLDIGKSNVRKCFIGSLVCFSFSEPMYVCGHK